MKISGFLWVICLPISLAGRSIELSSVTLQKEIINNITFIQRHETINGIAKHAWFINGQVVEQEEFDTEILEAEKEEQRIAREHHYRSLVEQQQYKEKHMRRGYEKLLTKSIEHVEQILHKIDALHLDQFLFFNPKTYATRENYDTIRAQLIPDAYEMLQNFGTHFDKQKIQEMVQKLDETSELVRTLIHDSIEYAIAHCDDTKVLKELLATVEQL